MNNNTPTLRPPFSRSSARYVKPTGCRIGSTNMIYAASGLVEENCVFTTPHHGAYPTVWTVTEYDPVQYYIGFVRVTPGELLVRIQIQVQNLPAQGGAVSHITYRYTPLQPKVAQDLQKNLDKDWKEMMMHWEKAINHYLATGEQW